MITAEVNADRVVLNAKNISRVIQNGVPKRLLDVGFELMRLSQMEVPHDKGTLQNSGVVETVGEDVVVGYHTPYAARLHEHPEYNFQRGRKGKYLSDPAERNQQVLGLRFTDGFGQDLREAIK